MTIALALLRLRQLLVRRVSHVAAQLDKHRLHGHIAVPALQAWQLGRVDGSVGLVDAWQVDLGDELDGGWLVGVLGAAVHLEGVNAVFVDRLDGRVSFGLRLKLWKEER